MQTTEWTSGHNCCLYARYSFCFWLEVQVYTWKLYENRNDCIIPCSVLRFTITQHSNGRNNVTTQWMSAWTLHAWINQMGLRRSLGHLCPSTETLLQIFSTPNPVCPDSFLNYLLLVLPFYALFGFHPNLWKRWVLAGLQNLNSVTSGEIQNMEPVL